MTGKRGIYCTVLSVQRTENQNLITVLCLDVCESRPTEFPMYLQDVDNGDVGLFIQELLRLKAAEC